MPGVHHGAYAGAEPDDRAVFRSLKEECVWLFNFRDLAHAEQEIGRWMEKYNTERPHEALGWLTPAQARGRQLEQAA